MGAVIVFPIATLPRRALVVLSRRTITLAVRVLPPRMVVVLDTLTGPRARGGTRARGGGRHEDEGKKGSFPAARRPEKRNSVLPESESRRRARLPRRCAKAVDDVPRATRKELQM